VRRTALALAFALAAACGGAGGERRGGEGPPPIPPSYGPPPETVPRRPGPSPAPAGSPTPAGSPRAAAAQPGAFAENPIVYFLITDRFLNGNPGNDGAYGRRRDGEREIGTFHGGDLAGVTRKLEEGYFRALGVNALWITAPYEQIRGWVVGGNREFRHYPYHGYYALDYTLVDQSMGTPDDLRALVDTAHAQGIRVIFDVVMNHPGYADLWTLGEFLPELLWPGWQRATPKDYHGFINYNDRRWVGWWGPDWVRAGLFGYQEGGLTDLTRQIAFLPDFKTESPEPVDLPPLLRKKPDTRARPIRDATVRTYLVAWLARWVREYGVDGFRCDTVKHVEPAAWRELKAAALTALEEWKAANPGKAVDGAPFWMTGEVFPHGVERDGYFDNGFDNLINFDFQERAGNLPGIDRVYREYADRLSRDVGFNVLSYLSSHDTHLFDRGKLIDGGTALLLAPGGVQVFYGDETGRPPGPAASSDPHQATRSDMNWEAIDQAVLAHWRTLGTFRARHVALAKGRHLVLAEAPYTFGRIHPRDRVVAALGVGGPTEVTVAGVFADGERLRDAYGGSEAVVTGGRVAVAPHPSGVVLLERAPVTRPAPRAGSAAPAPPSGAAASGRPAPLGGSRESHGPSPSARRSPR
jgi:alpha-amylase